MTAPIATNEKIIPASPLMVFLRAVSFADLPTDVVHQTKRCLLDLIGVAAAGSTLSLSHIINNHAASQFGGEQARLFFDGRKVSATGAALANGMTIDAFDAHDGHPVVKGHAGCGLLPALCAMAEQKDMSGADFLTELAKGYEIAIRAGMALHDTVTDYHTSGAWVAVGCAAICGNQMGLTDGEIRQAIGIAEYHGPRSQMMRVIDHPTMLKDGSGWGAMAGVSAAHLAQDGFTGAPAITVEADDVADIWKNLATRWMILEQYFKPYPVCRWAQPAVEAALTLQRNHDVAANDIEQIEVYSFHEAVRLATRRPKNSEEAQYSLPYPVAAALVRGTLGPNEVGDNGLGDPGVLRLVDTIILKEEDRFNDVFPAERWAQVVFYLKDGRQFQSDDTVAHGNAENPLSDDEINTKFHNLMLSSGLSDRADELMDLVWNLDQEPSMAPLLDLIMRAK